jgi:hypothetical protein
VITLPALPSPAIRVITCSLTFGLSLSHVIPCASACDHVVAVSVRPSGPTILAQPLPRSWDRNTRSPLRSCRPDSRSTQSVVAPAGIKGACGPHPKGPGFCASCSPCQKSLRHLVVSGLQPNLLLAPLCQLLVPVASRLGWIVGLTCLLVVVPNVSPRVANAISWFRRRIVSLFLFPFLLGPTIGVLPRPSSGWRVWGRFVGIFPHRLLVSSYASLLMSVGNSGNPLPRTAPCGIVPTIPLVSVELGVLVVLVLVLPGHQCLVVATAVVLLLFVVALLILLPGERLDVLKANLLGRLNKLADEELEVDLEFEKLQARVLEKKRVLRSRRLRLKSEIGALTKKEQEMYDRELGSIEEMERLEKEVEGTASASVLSPEPAGPVVSFVPSDWLDLGDPSDAVFFSEFPSVVESGGTPPTSVNS